MVRYSVVKATQTQVVHRLFDPRMYFICTKILVDRTKGNIIPHAWHEDLVVSILKHETYTGSYFCYVLFSCFFTPNSLMLPFS